MIFFVKPGRWSIMIAKTVLMATLESVLSELGYVKKVIPNPHGFTKNAFAFVHPQEKGATQLLPAYDRNEQVPVINLVAAQVIADNWGIADKCTFERMLESAQQESSSVAAPTTVAA